MGIVFIVLFYQSLLAASLIHELGHLLAVKFVGYALTTFAVGPLSISFQESRINFSLRKRLTSGVVRFRRNDNTASLKNDVIVFVSGILANFLVGGVLIWLYLSFPMFSKAGLLMVIGVMSILVGLGSLVPMHYKSLGLDSDGLTLLKAYRLWRSLTRNPMQ